MKSPILNHFGKPTTLRVQLRRVVASIKRGDSLLNGSEFILGREGAREAEIRANRPTGKKRYHIYNYERDNARHIYHMGVYITADEARVPLAYYHSFTNTIEVNHDHAPVIVKTLVSVLAYDFPEAKLQEVHVGRPAYILTRPLGPQQPLGPQEMPLYYGLQGPPMSRFVFDEVGSASWDTARLNEIVNGIGGIDDTLTEEI